MVRQHDVGCLVGSDTSCPRDQSFSFTFEICCLKFGLFDIIPTRILIAMRHRCPMRRLAIPGGLLLSSYLAMRLRLCRWNVREEVPGSTSGHGENLTFDSVRSIFTQNSADVTLRELLLY